MRRSALEPFLHKLLANDTPDAKNRLIIIDGSIRGVQLAPSGDRISVMKGKRNDGADFEIEGIDLIMGTLLGSFGPQSAEGPYERLHGSRTKRHKMTGERLHGSSSTHHLQPSSALRQRHIHGLRRDIFRFTNPSEAQGRRSRLSS